MQQHSIELKYDLFHLIRTDALKSLIVKQSEAIKPGDRVIVKELIFSGEEPKLTGNTIEVYATTRNCLVEGLAEGYCLVSFNAYASPVPR